MNSPRRRAWPAVVAWVPAEDFTGAGRGRDSPRCRGSWRESSLRRRKKRRRRETVGPVSTKTPAQEAITITGVDKSQLKASLCSFSSTFFVSDSVSDLFNGGLIINSSGIATDLEQDQKTVSFLELEDVPRQARRTLIRTIGSLEDREHGELPAAAQVAATETHLLMRQLLRLT